MAATTNREPAGTSEAIAVAGIHDAGGGECGGEGGGEGGAPLPPFWNVARSPADNGSKMTLGVHQGGSAASVGHQRDMSLSASASCVLEDCRKELSNLRQVRRRHVLLCATTITMTTMTTMTTTSRSRSLSRRL